MIEETIESEESEVRRHCTANVKRRSARAVRYFAEANHALGKVDHREGYRAITRGLKALRLASDSSVGQVVLGAFRGEASVGVDAETLVSELSGRSLSELKAICRGMAFLGLYRQSAVVRRLVRERLLVSLPRGRDDFAALYVMALIESDQMDIAREILESRQTQLAKERTLRSMALQCGYQSRWLTRGWSPPEATKRLVSGRHVVLVGPAGSLKEVQGQLGQSTLLATFKYLGEPIGSAAALPIDISFVNSRMYPELEQRFSSPSAQYTMNQCRLVISKNKGAPHRQPSVAFSHMAAQPALLIEKATFGLRAIEELLLAGSAGVHVTGFDLWTSRITHRVDYPFFSSDMSRNQNGGLTAASVARSAGTHEPISQLNYLKRLRSLGLISADGALSQVLNFTEEEYAERLARIHGWQIAGGVPAREG